MERIVQLLDDLDDIISIVGLAGERIRTILFLALVVFVSILVQGAGVLLALRHPAAALVAAMLMFAILLYRTVSSLHVSHRAATGTTGLNP